jgi:hypothetical protein
MPSSALVLEWEVAALLEEISFRVEMRIDPTTGPNPAPGRPIKAAKGLSIGGAEGSTKLVGSPIGEDSPGREALPPAAAPAEACRRACMNCCWCSGSHAEGLLGELAVVLESESASKRLESPATEELEPMLVAVPVVVRLLAG